MIGQNIFVKIFFSNTTSAIFWI